MSDKAANISPKLRATLAKIAQASAQQSQRDDAQRAQAEGPKLAPTPEQLQRGKFAKMATKTKRGQVSSSTYRRQPLFETLAKGNTGIDEDGLRALRFYREAHEASARSETRCALNREVGGGGGDGPTIQLVKAKERLAICEAALGPLLPTMRAVVLNDYSFSDVAIDRFGGRKQNWIVMEETSGRTTAKAKGRKPARFVDKIVPKSGRHREQIKNEFMIGLERLTAAVGPYVRTG